VGLVVSLILIAVGAILIWGVNADSTDFNVDAVGVILMIVGVLSFALTLFFWQSFWGPGYFRRRTYVEGGGDPYYDRRYWGPRRRATVVEEEDVPPAPGPPGPPPP